MGKRKRKWVTVNVTRTGALDDRQADQVSGGGTNSLSSSVLKKSDDTAQQITQNLK